MAFTPVSTAQPVKAVLFDVFGTVVDWRTGVAAAVRRFAAEHGLDLDVGAFADAWRSRYVPAMRRVSTGARPFVSLDVLHRENLDGVLTGLGLDPGRFGPAALDELNRAWHFLPPWPDSVPGITVLKQGYIVGPLSNGNTSLLLDMAKAAGLPWDVILGSDVTRAYKPAMEAYLRPAALLGLDPGEIMLAAAHEADLEAARNAGLAAAFHHFTARRLVSGWLSTATPGITQGLSRFVEIEAVRPARRNQMRIHAGTRPVRGGCKASPLSVAHRVWSASPNSSLCKRRLVSAEKI